ncbi:DUF6575 domain-containing protein [Chitinophaga niabensis]|uniref:DUF6575 domain-containing protein n=1 Tax=Chitinophaga niabensis TaxID=536979 RepID=A0A1N6FJ49_9BACT|nr:DUF6575 domain-containing protein [Chitinophaga niabensis]SIN95285.1 hypothetical protein SAMN04488055_2248 [Chitinophaga niabensis]
MQKNLNIFQILVYYDIPELFIATDTVDTKYVCLLLELSNGYPKYIATPISQLRLANFLKGDLELKEILISPEMEEWYSIALNDDKIIATKSDLDHFPQQFLPEEGFYLNSAISDGSQIVEEVIEKNNAVVHLAISDNIDDYGADANDLGDIIKLYSILLENSYKKSVIEHKVKDKGIIIPANYQLRAFASSRNSFNVHLYSKSQKDLFGNCMIEYGLEKISKVLEYSDDDDLIKSLRSIKGHAVASLKKISKRIIDDKLKIKHKWFAPNQEVVHFQIFDADKATVIFNILNQSEELTEEIKEFIGVFVQADVKRGTWRIKAMDDKQEHHGEANPDDLKGITLETVTYKLICQEIIEEFKVSEKGKIKYIFKSIEELRNKSPID